MGLEEVSTFQLLQWKHGVRLEKQLNGKGHRVFRRSLRKFVAEYLKLSPRTKHDVIIELVDAELDVRKAVLQAHR